MTAVASRKPPRVLLLRGMDEDELQEGTLDLKSWKKKRQLRDLDQQLEVLSWDCAIAKAGLKLTV